MQARIARAHTRVREGMKAPYCTVSPLPMRPELDMRAITVLITKSIDVTWIALLSSQRSSFTQQDEHIVGWVVQWGHRSEREGCAQQEVTMRLDGGTGLR